jgi:hypothetical protein
MFDPIPSTQDRYPTLRQAIILGIAGVVLALGGCAGFLLTGGENIVATFLGITFVLGALFLLTSAALFVFTGIKGLINSFRDHQ